MCKVYKVAHRCQARRQKSEFGTFTFTTLIKHHKLIQVKVYHQKYFVFNDYKSIKLNYITYIILHRTLFALYTS